MVDILHLIDDYDWLFDQYITLNKTARRISKDLGINDTTIGRYLKKAEIEIKYTFRYSLMCISWLNSIIEKEDIDIQHALNIGEYNIPGTRYRADGYCEKTNTIYEFHGDYWHGNPNIHAPDAINEVLGVSMGELYLRTIKRENQIISLGYNLVIMWESNFNEVINEQ
jgi:hypothetical protein